MKSTPPEFRDTRVEKLVELIDGEITQIIALHLTNIKIWHIPLVRTNVVLPDETVRVFQIQISRAAERIVREVLIPEFGKRGELSLNPDVLRIVMLNFGKLQVVFEKVFKKVFADTFPDEFLKQAAATYVSLFDKEMMIAMVGGRPKDETQEENAGAHVDRMVDEFVKRTQSFVCPLGKKSPDQ